MHKLLLQLYWRQNSTQDRAASDKLIFHKIGDVMSQIVQERCRVTMEDYCNRKWDLSDHERPWEFISTFVNHPKCSVFKI